MHDHRAAARQAIIRDGERGINGTFRNRGSISILDPRTEYNAFTIKGTGKTYPTFKETVEAIDFFKGQLSNRGKFAGDIVFEFDSKHRIHAHGTILSYRSLYHPHYRHIGWHIHLTKLEDNDDLRKWQNYLNKEKVPIALCQQYDMELYSQRHNMFLSELI